MVSRLCFVSGIVGSPHGTNSIRPTPDVRFSTAFHCCLLWIHRIDDVLCRGGEFYFSDKMALFLAPCGRSKRLSFFSVRLHLARHAFESVLRSRTQPSHTLAVRPPSCDGQHPRDKIKK